MDGIIINHLQQYDVSKLEVAMRALMKQLAATLSRQRGVQYEFGPEYDEYKAKKQRVFMDRLI